jgi:hypothetical protein
MQPTPTINDMLMSFRYERGQSHSGNDLAPYKNANIGSTSSEWISRPRYPKAAAKNMWVSPTSSTQRADLKAAPALPVHLQALCNSTMTATEDAAWTTGVPLHLKFASATRTGLPRLNSRSSSLHLSPKCEETPRESISRTINRTPASGKRRGDFLP